MSDEKNKTSGQGAATLEGPGPNTVRVTFMPANKTFEFEKGQLPYADHGKPESILDVAMNNDFFLDMAAGLTLHSRLGCQAVIDKPGELVVEIPEWNRNYVSEGHAPKD